ncbi:MAG: TonB-dependent siderophore receptor [Pseudomonas sp.]|uniref:TonB-dependent siderophore receptor n=1 Tax=Pseudomonas sp. TaxID=306 RepID=UPI003982C38E
MTTACRPQTLTLSPLSTSIRRTLVCSALLSAIIVMNVVQADTPPQHEYHIAQGDLSQALTGFAAEAGIVLSFDSSLTHGKTSPGLNGRANVEDGLRQLLVGSGLRVVREDDGRYSLVATADQSNVLELGATTIVGNQLGTVTEGTGSYTPGTIATATRLVLTPRETPQSVTVITRQHLDDFGLSNVDDVMRHTPGITVSAYDSDRTNYYARGFSINNFQYDGIPSTARNVGYAAGNTLSDMAIYDRVEVLKGATGLLTGAGSLGATINLVRKKPTHEFQGHFELGAGSWDNYRSEVDVSGPLTESGNVRGRAVAAYQDKHSFMDRYQRKNSVYYGILEFDLSEDTLLTVGADYQNTTPKASSWSGTFPLFDGEGNRNNVSRSFNNGANWSSWEQYTRTLFANIEHTFANDWVAKVQLDHKINGYHAPLGSIQGSYPNTDGSAGIYPAKYVGKTTSDSIELYGSGPFQLLGREHQLVVGASGSVSRWRGDSYWSPNAYDSSVSSFDNWNGDIAEPNWGSVSQKIRDTTRQVGTYTTARFNFTDELNVLIGGRFVDYSVTGRASKESGRFIPYVGATYDLNKNFSLYASYTDIFMPADNWWRDRNDKILEPDEGQNYEVGVKGEFYEGALNASLAYFEIHEDNRGVGDDEYNFLNPMEYAYKAIAAKTKGYEAEVSGELAPGWQVQAGYTHKIIREDGGGKVSTWEPEDQVSVYTHYTFKGSLDRLSIGGGARWQGKTWQAVNNYPQSTVEDFDQKSFWLVDLMARYQITDNLSSTVNVNNVFDKTYYTNMGFYQSGTYGEPRNFMVNTRWDF